MRNSVATLFLMVFSVVFSFVASGVTYEVELDKTGGIYRCGEQATFTVRLLSTNSLAFSVSSRAILDNFGTSVLTNIEFDVTGEVGFDIGVMRQKICILSHQRDVIESESLEGEGGHKFVDVTHILLVSLCIIDKLYQLNISQKTQIVNVFLLFFKHTEQIFQPFRHFSGIFVFSCRIYPEAGS